MVGRRCKFISYQLTFWVYEHFHESENVQQNSFTNDLHKHSFCSCFMNEAQCVYVKCIACKKQKSLILRMFLNIPYN